MLHRRYEYEGQNDVPHVNMCVVMCASAVALLGVTTAGCDEIDVYVMNVDRHMQDGTAGTDHEQLWPEA